MNSILKHPRLIDCPYLTTLRFVSWSILCSFNFDSMIAVVSLVAYTGTLTSLSTYGSAPIWSSCPCVITNPFTLLIFSLRYDTSGITRSIPSMSSSGNASPQSTTIILSSDSKAVMFIPICSRPPNGITLTVPSFSFFKINTVSFLYCLPYNA